MTIRSLFTKGKIITTIVVLLVAGGVFAFVKSKNKPAQNIQTDTVKRQDLVQTVLATGQVTSSTNLNLSFKSSGVVGKVGIKVGAKVVAGQVLANLEQRDQLASLTSARGSLAQAQAGYQKVLAGASSEEVAVAQKSVDAAQVSLDNAKKSLEDTKRQQGILVKNAYSALLNTGIAAIPDSANMSSATLAVSGAYTEESPATYVVTVEQLGGGWRYEVKGPGQVYGVFNAGVPLSLTTRGLYGTFSVLPSSGDTWTIDVPNTKSSSYVTYQNAYNAALETQRTAITTGENAIASATVALDQANASLNLKKAQARPADMQAAQAQILSAQGQVEAAQASLENTIIRAPIDGTITSIDIKAGELTAALKEVFILQDVGSLHVEANVSEANIANLKLGQEVAMTLDALGPDKTFIGQLVSVDPASTVVSGVVNYKVTTSIDNLPEIKPGMTANITVTTARKASVLAVPSRAVISRESKKFVRVITDTQTKTHAEVVVSVGLEADGGLTEVLSGLTEGQEVITFISTK